MMVTSLEMSLAHGLRNEMYREQSFGLRASFLTLQLLQGRGISNALSVKIRALIRPVGLLEHKSTSRCATRGLIEQFMPKLSEKDK